MSMQRKIRRNIAKEEFQRCQCGNWYKRGECLAVWEASEEFKKKNKTTGFHGPRPWKEVWKSYTIGRSADPKRRPFRSVSWIAKAIAGNGKLESFLDRMNPPRNNGWLGLFKSKAGE